MALTGKAAGSGDRRTERPRGSASDGSTRLPRHTEPRSALFDRGDLGTLHHGLASAASTEVERDAARVLGLPVSRIRLLGQSVSLVTGGGVVNRVLDDLAEPRDEAVQGGDDEECAHPRANLAVPIRPINRPRPVRSRLTPPDPHSSDPLRRARGIFPGVPRRLLFTSLGLLLACAEQTPPAYTRVSGPAPAVLSPTRTPATLVVFWATWCPPCREEVGPLRALAQDPPRDLSVVTFGQDEPGANVAEFFGGRVPPELGYRPDSDHRAAAAFGVDVLPATFLVVDGQLVARFGGARDWNSKEMRNLLVRLASEGKAATAR